jgi:hypothetical protein
MRITKDVAESTAEKMTAKKSLELLEMRNLFSEKIRNLILKQVPKEIIEAFEKHPNYINSIGYVYLYGIGFNGNSVKFTKVPYMGDNRFEIKSEMGATELLKQFNKIEALEKEIKDLKLEIETALYSTLKTYKRVQESFPEALQYLPKLNNDKTALVVNLSSLRDKIK